MIKKEEGITLMALVITIIVLIILAGISIGSIYDKDNIVDETENATYQAQKQSIITKIEAELLEEQTKTGDTPTKDTLKEVITNSKFSEGEPGENSFITKDGGYTINYSEIKGWE